MILYHGSPYFFQQFKPTITFFSETEKFARDYADTKSMDFALDATIKIYKVEAKTKLFDINNPNHEKQLIKLLPDKVSYTYNNFGFSAEISKDEIIMNMKGFDIVEPIKGIKDLGIGDSFPNPEYEREEILILHKDSNYIYGTYKHRIDEEISSIFASLYSNERNRASIRTREAFKEPIEYIKDYFKENKITFYSREHDIYIETMKFLKLEDVEFTKLYNQSVQKLYKMYYDEGICRKYVLKPTKIELSDTWRYFENKTVTNAIKKLNYGGYVAKERRVNTYAIFNPQLDTKILEYNNNGNRFSSWEDYMRFKEHDKYIASKYQKGDPWINSWEIYKLYKQGKTKEETAEILLKK